MRRLMQLTFLLILAGAVTGSAEAQRRRGLQDVTPDGDRRGFWITPALGAGSESFKFDDDAFSESISKPTIALRLGGTVSPSFRLGGEATVWWNETQVAGENITETLSSFMLIGQFYPVRDAGLYLKGGAGIGRSAADVEFGVGTGETGFAFAAGAGYDIRLGRKVWLTPSVDFYRHQFTKRNQPTLHERLLFVGVGITFQPGR